jgi:hypothetical protein
MANGDVPLPDFGDLDDVQSLLRLQHCLLTSGIAGKRGWHLTRSSAPYYLAVWKTPRVRTDRAAEDVVRKGPEAFGASPDLGLLSHALADDRRISVDRQLGRPPDRFLLLAVPRADLAELGPRIASLCEQLGLMLMDVQHGRLVVPRRLLSRDWPVGEPPTIATLRGALESTPLTGDMVLDRKARRRHDPGSGRRTP